MSRLHVKKLRTGQGSKDEYQVEEHAPLRVWDGVDTYDSFDVVGKRIPRVEGADKVSGRARYSYDIRLPGQLVARVLRSPLPHARIKRLDTSAARAFPGVYAVASSADVSDVPWYEHSQLFDTTVRFVGDEVAAVAAINGDVAEDALRLIDVEYEPLAFVTDLAAALAPGAPLVWPSGNTAGGPEVYARGDVARAFEEAEVVIDEVYETQTALHNCLEPHGCTAAWEGDNLTLWDSTQSVFDVREEVAQKLGLPEHRVRVIKQFMGGGFGSKQIAWKHDVIAAILAKRSGRPVQLMLDREGENLAVGNRNPTRQRLRIGARRDGTLLAIDARIEMAVGAHQVGGESSIVDGTYQRLYRCPNVRTEQVAIFTNTGPAVAFRAPGYVEGAFALEQAMDELARKLKLDPLELRMRNYTREDQQESKPYTSPDGLKLCYERATEAFGWLTRDRSGPRTGSKRRGFGIAAHDWGGSGSPPGYAWVKLNADGSADVVTGTQDIGTGARTGLSQVAAEELGLELDQVRLHLGDTAYGPYAPVSSGSATQATIGPAVRAAAAEVRAQLVHVAAPMLSAPPEALKVRAGRVFLAAEPGRSLSVKEVTSKIGPHMLQGFGARGPNPEDKAVRTFGVQCVEVEVDVDTGQVRVLRVAAAHDCGRIINPMLVESQVMGGITQGLGFALTEERVVDAKSGVVLNANLEEYHVPTVLDVPQMIHAAVDVPDKAANPTGAKGIGEPPLIPTAPAIANAIFDATGIRVRQSPISRRRLLEALMQQEESQSTQQQVPPSSAAPSATQPAMPSDGRSATHSTASSDAPSTSQSGTSAAPSMIPSASPSDEPAATRFGTPQAGPSASQSGTPQAGPSAIQSGTPQAGPSATQSGTPQAGPSAIQSGTPQAGPSAIQSGTPQAGPSATQSGMPQAGPSATRSGTPQAEASGAQAQMRARPAS